MKQQVLCCLLLTISAGTCHTYGVKGALSKSYSSSSAAASSSSFSSSFSSAEDADLNDIANSLKIGSQAGSAAFAQAGADGAKSGSGAFAGSSSGAFSGASSGAFAGANSGSYSKSGSYSGSGLQTGQSGSEGHSGSAGSYSGSGLQTGQTGSGGHSGGAGSYSGSGLQNGQSGSGGHSGSAGSYSGSGSFSKSGSTCASCSGSGDALIPAFGTGTDTETGSFNGGSTIGQNKESVGHGSNLDQEDTKLKTVNNPGYNSDSAAGGNIFVNDFQIPVEFQNPKTKPALHKDIQGSQSNSYNGANSGAYQGSISKSKPCCQGPFPGPKGSIHDFKPAPPGGGGPPAWVPEEQKPAVIIPTQPNPINTGYHQDATNAGSTGLSSQLIHSFPGSQGGIHDSKPAYNKPSNQGGNIPVSVIPVVVETPQYHQQPSQTLVPGSGASSVIGLLPGPTGSIHTSVPVGQKPTQQIFVQPIPNYGNKKPVPSPDIINSFPGKPGNINDNKPTSPCAGGQCQSNNNVYYGNAGAIGVDLSEKPKVPDCSTGQCDEFGGKLGCHGDACFGPGKKPSNAHISGSNANSNAHYGSGSINIDLSKPSTDTYQHGLCKSGKCNVQQPGPELIIVDVKPSNVPYVIEQKPYEKPAPGLIIVDVPPSNVPFVIEQKPYDNPSHIPSGSQQKPNLNVYPAPGSINFDVNQPTPTYPGTLCSGIDCLLPPATGTKQFPSASNAGCSGAYCIDIIPEPQENPSCTGENCGNKVPNCVGNSCLKNNQPKNVYQHSNSGSNSNAQASEGQEKVLIEQPIEVEISSSPVIPEGGIPKESSTTSKPYDKGSSHDFLLPGNKPLPHRNIKPHQPTLPKKQSEKTPGEGYYSCTGTSCPLPKHPGQITPHQTQNVPFNEPSKIQPSPDQQGKITCSGAGCIPQSNVPDGYTGDGVHDRLYPGYNQGLPQLNCNGNACSTPQLKPFKIPDEYKGEGIHGQKEQYPLVIPVVEIQEDNPTGSNFHTGGNSGSNGFVSGTVVVEKSDGIEIPVVDVLIPGSNQPGYSCSGSQCDGPKQTKDDRFTSGSNSGYFPGSSGGHIQENVQGSGCSGGLCGILIPSGSSGGCSSGKCGSNGGSYSGSTGGNLQGNFQGSGCSTGKCGTDLSGGSSSGSGSFSGSGSYGGAGVGPIKTGEHPQRNIQGSGCSSGKCGSNGGSYSGSTGGNLQGSGCSTGKCGTDLTGGSSSGSGSYGGAGVVPIKTGDLQGSGCSSGKCGTDFSGGSLSGSGSGSSSGSGSYGGGKVGCKSGTCGGNSGAFSSSSSFSGSGSGAYSGSGSQSYSTSGNGAGIEGLPLLKELINQSIKGGDFHTEAGAFSGASSYSGGGSSSHSSAYSSAGSFAAK